MKLAVCFCVMITCLNAIFGNAAAQDGSVAVPAAGEVHKNIVLTKEERDWLESNPDITFGYADSQEPQLIINPDGSYRGVVVDLLDELNRRLGTAIRLEAFSIKELFRKAKNHELDGVLNLHPGHAERLEMLKTNGYFQNFPAVFGRGNLVFNGPEDIAGKTIAIIDKVYFSEQMIREYEGLATIKRVKNALEGLQSLEKGEADIFIGVSHNSYFISKYQLYDVAIKYIFTDYKDRTVIAVRPDWQVLVGILNKGLSSFSDSELKQIVARWVRLPEQETIDILNVGDRNWLAVHPEIVFGYTDAFEPAAIVNKDGSYRGYLVDLLNLLNQRLDTNFKLTIKPIPEIISQVTEKELDGVLAIHPDYAEKLGWLSTQTHMSTYPTVFARTGTTFVEPTDLAGKKIALIDKVFFSQDLVDLYGDGSTLVKVENTLEGMERVKDGTADFFIGTSTNSYLLTKYHFFDLAAVFQFYQHPSPNGFGVRDDWPQLVSILNKGLASFSAEEMEAILRKWGLTPEQEEVIELTTEERSWLAQNNIVRVRVVDRPPFIYLDNGKPVGLAVDLLNEVSRLTGMPFHYVVPSPSFKEDLDGLIQHEGPDLIVTITPTQEREKNILFTKAYMSSPKFIFTRNDTPFIASVEELNGTTVAVIEGFIVHDLLVRDYPNIDLLLFKTSKEALGAVSSGKAHAFIDSLFTTPSMINRFGFNNLKASAPASSFPDSTANMGVRNDWPELRDILNRVLDTMPPEKKSSLLNKWSTIKFDHGIEPSDMLKWVLGVAGIATFIILLFVGWNRQLSRLVDQRTTKLQETIESLAVEVKERVAAEKDLASKEAEEFALINAVNNPFFLMETNGTIVVANESMAKVNDKTADELIGTNTYDSLPEDIAENRRKHVDRAVSSGEAYIFEDERSGRVVEHRLYPVKDGSGVVEKLAAFATDITKEVETQRLLKTSEEEFRSLVEQSPLSVQIFTPDGTLSTINQAWIDLWGISGDMLQEVIKKYNILEDEEARMRGLMPYIEKVFGGESIVLPIVEYDASTTLEKLDVAEGIGHSRYVQLRMYPVKNSVGEVLRVVGIEEDLTEKIQAEEALRQSHDYLEHVTGTMSDAVFSVRMPERIIEWANDSFQVLGYEPEEYIGQSADKFYSDSSEFNRVGRLLAEAIAAGDQMVHTEIELIRKNGEAFPAELSTTLFRENGEVTSLTALVRDITERKRAEEEIQQYQERLKALASQLTVFEEAERRRIAAGLHDHIGQILAFSRIQLAKAKKQASDDSQVALLDEISKSLLQVIEDTKLLIFDLSSPLLNEIGLDAAITDWLEHQVKNRHGLDYTYRQEDMNVELNEIERTIFFRNFKELVTNIVKHAKAGRIDVSLSSSDNQFVLTVADDGLGFNPEQVRDKSPVEGGFGLFSIQERMADIGGTMRIVSEPDSGCTATLTLPVHVEEI